MHARVSELDAGQAADLLITADLWGIDTHGVARLPAYYELLVNQKINPHPNIRIVRSRLSTAMVDGDNGLGLIIGPKVNEIAIEKAEQTGAGWVGVYNSNHFGIAGYYPYQALPLDIIGFAMTNTTPQVAPLWGAERMLGTNPIAVAFPGNEEPPIIIDFATSAVSYGKVENALRKNEIMPEGCIADCNGVATVNPEEMINGGVILPLGTDFDHGGHKGYCLTAMVDILCGVLTGASWGPFVPQFLTRIEPPKRVVGKGVGHLFGALQIDGFIDPKEFRSRVDGWIRVIRAGKPAPRTQGPLIPGDPERKAREVAVQEGITLQPIVFRELRALGARTGINFE